MMHVGLVCGEYPPGEHGGIGSVTRDLAEGLVAAGQAATVIGVEPGLDHAVCGVQNGVRVLRQPPAPGWMRYRPGRLWDRVRLARLLKKEARRQPFDLLECPDFGGWLPHGAPIPVPLVVRLHGSNLFFDRELKRPGNEFEHRLERRTLARADYWIAVSQYVAACTEQEANIQLTSPVEVVYNAVNSERFCPDPAIEVEPGLVVFVNSVLPKKGAEELVLAMNRVVRERPEAKLVLVGRNQFCLPDGTAYQAHLLALADEVLRSQLVFAGHADSEAVLNWLRRAQVCCFPSHSESFGIAPVEAMAVGRPTVYMRSGPGPEVIEHGVSGLLADTFAPDSLADCILQLLRDPQKADRLGRAARERVLTHFNHRQWVEKNIAIYSRIIAEYGRRR